MKKQSLLLLLFIFLMTMSGKVISQTVQLTPYGMFDQVYDRFGNQYALSDLQIPASSTGTGIGIFSLPTQTCVAGKFTLYFENGTAFTNSPSIQTVACQVFSDISSLINSSVQPGGVNIYCTDYSPPPGMVVVNPPAADASAYYVVPTSPINTNQGIIDGQVYKALTSGIDPYLNIPFGAVSNPSNPSSYQFYHGFIRVNPTYTFNTVLTTSVIASNETDLYSILLHEAMHTLGVLSLMQFDGSGSFSANFYSRYDSFLRDASGNPLLANPASTLCPLSNLTFAPSSNTVITTAGVTAATGSVVTPQNITPCSTAAQYISNSTTISLYTPNYYEPAISLSHFEDMCTGAYGGSCVATPTAPGYNDLYYVMSNLTAPGSCFVKRYLKDEERLVLCDLGYSVNAVFGSTTVVGSQYTYSAGACAPVNIVGINDGLGTGGAYTLITTGTSTVISYSTLLGNDIGVATANLSIPCLELIYSNATYTQGTNDFTVAATSGAGLVILKYVPKDNSGHYGNATYVFVYFAPPGCASCNMVNNGGFENISNASPLCGLFGGMISNPAGFPVLIPNYRQINCWERIEGGAYLVDVSCANGGGYVGTFIVESPFVPLNINPTTNNDCIGVVAGDVVKNSLSAPIQSSQTYQLSFWVKNQVLSAPPTNTLSMPVVITAASYSNYAALGSASNFPTGLDVLANFTVNASSDWQLVTASFVYTPSVAGNVLVLGINSALTPTGSSYACLIDEVSLINTATSPTFSIPSSTALTCSSGSLSNLAQYVTATGTIGSTGVFSGEGVTWNGSQYDFNASGTLSPGVYPIIFTYTTANGCTDVLYQSIFFNTPTISLSASDYTICSGGSTTLTATGNFWSSSLWWIPGPTPTVNPIVVSPTVTTTYTAFGTNACGNTGQPSITIYVITTPSISLSASGNGSICPANSVTLTASGTYTTLDWQPGGYSVSPIVVNPTVTTIYTVTSANGNCSLVPSPTIEIIVSSIPSSLYTTLSSPLSGNYSSGYYYVSADAVLSANTTFSNSEVIFGQNVKLTVTAGNTLNIGNAYLHTCGDFLWTGIVVEDGGRVNVYNNSLIEDALIAIDASNQYSSTVQPVILAQNAIFNKNYKDMVLTNYTNTAVTYSNVLKIDNSVFTCRNIPFGISSGSLRTANSSTTSEGSPYLQNYSVTGMKWPYAYTQARGIFLNNVGYTSGSNYYGLIIGANDSPSDFNLFDNHGVFINTENSNLALQNNVFQNQAGGFLVMNVSGNAALGLPAAAVIEMVSDTRKIQLDMSAGSSDVGNRFWDCNRAVEGRNVYDVKLSNAIMRSAHTTTDIGQAYMLSGEYGITLHSNRMNYDIHDNEFTNIGTGVNLPFNSNGSNTLTAIAIYNNTFSAGSSTATQFMAQSIIIPDVLSIPPTMPSPLPQLAPTLPQSTHPTGVAVVNNNLSNVWNGMFVNGFYGVPVWVAQNTLTLMDDNSSGYSTQHGIDLSACLSTTVFQQHVWLNGVHGQNTTNTGVSLIYSSLNSGASSPYINCNLAQNGYKGFVFGGYNSASLSFPGLQWFGNTMDNLGRGMQLEGASDWNNANTFEGVIGTQGDATTGMGNMWNSSWSGSNYGVYTNSSSAAYSPLYYQSAGTYTPPNIASYAPQDSYLYPGNIGALQTSSGSYSSCAYIPSIVVPVSPDFGDGLQAYLMNAQLYHFLRYNESIRESKDALNTWYEDMGDAGNFEWLELTQEKLYSGDYGGARDILNSLSAANYIEENDIAFYNLYADYLQAIEEGSAYSTEDSTALFGMVQLCPIVYGSSIYKARALYDDVYSIALMFEDCNVEKRDGRLAYNIQVKTLKDNWSVEIYPNPAENSVTIKSKNENEDLTIVITDILGRKVLDTHLKLNSFIAHIKLDLINGAYVVRIMNSQDKIITKKLLIAK